MLICSALVLFGCASPSESVESVPSSTTSSTLHIDSSPSNATTWPDGGEMTQVIVDLDVPWEPEAGLTEDQVTAQRDEIAEAQDAIVAELDGCEYEVVEKYEATPQMALRVDEDCLARLKDSDLVSAVNADQPDPSN